ncbi:hypothetical protein SDRG_14435 [Saprolegnia diclina VS20]|uniref:F-box domain-containing protein n=1 Tax=Saprolegnia diclina (strain VS20) TaxID=1156394 RepID=T0Q368_SAPDV|nr:hypothetical protein SDRG_14435 [Saprolegnia diclina VS20]EQC27855.1 hypothetical protein SDRG_14435 [Saprolegnia diclina VS20]|eukprot:XP_008618785.1 hypothetical protein SDRG_14435 [Saprolegnia diclina VS20]
MALALHATPAPVPRGPIQVAPMPLAPLATVNDDLLNAVTGFLAVEDVLAAAATSRAMFRSIHDHTTYWRDLELQGATSELLQRLVPFASVMRCVRFRKSTASTDAWLAFAQHTRDLIVLDVSGSKYVTDDVFRIFCARSAATLREVAADNCSWISTLAPMLPFAPSLRALSFNRCRQLVTGDVLDVVVLAPHLVSLELKGNPKVSQSTVVMTAIATCPQLKVLTLGGSGRYTKDVNAEFIQAFSTQNQAIALECLDLSCSNPFGSRSPLADDGLVPLLQLCPNMQALYLKGQSNLSSHIFSALPPRIKTLDVTGCALVTANLDGLACLPFLEELVLYACNNVTDDALLRLKVTHPHLVKVDVEGCTAVSAEVRDLFS